MSVRYVTVEEAQELGLFKVPPRSKLESMSREDLVQLAEFQEDLIGQLSEIIQSYKRRFDEEETRRQEALFTREKLLKIQDRVFGKSSEKRAPADTQVGADIEEKPKAPKAKRVLLPSERYPNAELVERKVELKEAPRCSCCGSAMTDTGMTEASEYIEKVPARYRIIRELRSKYSCKRCYGDMVTAPAIQRIKPGSAYGDGMIIDVAVSKFSDLIPVTRQVRMAGQAGFPGLPHQSLIECTHYLADFLKPVYEKIRGEVLESEVLYADETPHRMLEGHKKESWHFWGFSSERSAYFEAHDTRSGDVAIELIQNSKCRYLMSDVYSGYGRTVTAVNEYRLRNGIPKLIKIYCNAHARRKFIEAKNYPSESEFFIRNYQRIYCLESQARGKPPDEILAIRSRMIPIFEEMRQRALEDLVCHSTKSAISEAYQYFLKNYGELTEFTRSTIAPIDNNHQERLLRNPVIGRKTWYGTHSVRGAETTAILFSVMESCKLNDLNPRVYLHDTTHWILSGEEPLTPKEYRERNQE